MKKFKKIITSVFNYFNNIFLRNKYKNIKILNSDETIDYVIDNKLSVCRFGDGEMFIIDKEAGCGFQDIDDDLSDRLKNIFFDFDNNNALICIPNWMFNKDELNLRTKKSQKWCKKYLINHFKTWTSKVNLDYTYGDTSFNRRYISTNDKSNSRLYFDNLKKIWDGKDVCFVEGEKTRLGVGNDLFDNAKSIKRIIAPSENAFKKINEIEKSCKKLSKNTLFLIALGPTATVISYDLSKIGFQAIDIGHIDVEYEWFLMGATEVVPLKNKYVNESSNKGNTQEFVDDVYESQIVERIL